MFQLNLHEQLSTLTWCLKWLLITLVVGVLTGSACALFLWLLDEATTFRLRQAWMPWFLPLAGAAIAAMYVRWGRTVEAGNNLVIDEILEPRKGVPLRMTPLVLIGTVVTHLFGGSAGREGTAVQMGGSIASGICRLLPSVGTDDRRILLLTGVAAGFGGVFGTPVAGTVFAMEMLSIGRMQYGAVIPCLMSSVISDQTCTALGIEHTRYHVSLLSGTPTPFELSPVTLHLLAAVCIAGILFGLTSLLFSEVTHSLQSAFRRRVANPMMRPVIGGTLVLLATRLLGTKDYLGLGVSSGDSGATTIVNSFHGVGITAWSWLWKLLLTAMTVSCGFKGGEVTPLFFMGATLGSALAGPMGVPVDFLAAMGFVAVFAGATNTPLACTIMAVELFGGQHILYFAISCFTAFLFSGRSGIYQSQQLSTAKSECTVHEKGVSLRSMRSGREKSSPSAAENLPADGNNTRPEASEMP